MINKKLLTAAAFIALTSSACIAKDLGNFSIGIEGSYICNFGGEINEDAKSLLNKITDKFLEDKHNLFNTFRISSYLQGYVMEDFYLGLKANYHINPKVKVQEKVEQGIKELNIPFLEKTGAEFAGETIHGNPYIPILGVQAFAGYDIYSDSNLTLSLEVGAGWTKHSVSDDWLSVLRSYCKDGQGSTIFVSDQDSSHTFFNIFNTVLTHAPMASKPFDINLALKTTYKTDIVDIHAKIGYEYDFFSQDIAHSLKSLLGSRDATIGPMQDELLNSIKGPSDDKNLYLEKKSLVEHITKQNALAPSPISGHNFIFSIGLSKSF